MSNIRKKTSIELTHPDRGYTTEVTTEAADLQRAIWRAGREALIEVHRDVGEATSFRIVTYQLDLVVELLNMYAISLNTFHEDEGGWVHHDFDFSAQIGWQDRPNDSNIDVPNVNGHQIILELGFLADKLDRVVAAVNGLADLHEAGAFPAPGTLDLDLWRDDVNLADVCQRVVAAAAVTGPATCDRARDESAHV